MLYLFLPARARARGVPAPVLQDGYPRRSSGGSATVLDEPPLAWLSRLIRGSSPPTRACACTLPVPARKGDVVVTDADAALIARSAGPARRGTVSTETGKETPSRTRRRRWRRSRRRGGTQARGRFQPRGAPCGVRGGARVPARDANGARARCARTSAGEKDGTCGGGIYNKCYVPVLADSVVEHRRSVDELAF